MIPEPLGDALQTLAKFIGTRDVVTVRTPGLPGSVTLGGAAVREDLRVVAAELERLRCCGNCCHSTTVPDYVPRCQVLEHDVPAEEWCTGDVWPDPSGPCALPQLGLPDGWERRP